MINKFLKPEVKKALLRFALEYGKKRAGTLKQKNEGYEKKQTELKVLREKIFKDLKAIQNQTVKALEKNGIQVHLAQDASEARKIFNRIVGKKTRLAQAKTSALAEITNKDFLKGKNLLKTDLGDFLANLIDNNQGAHPVLPIIEFSSERITELLYQKFKKRVESTPEAISRFVKGEIRQRLLEIQVGITGANAVTAQGEIVLIENEGNISLVSRLPETHIVIVGMEKLVPSLKEANQLIEAMCLWGTGQDKPVYTSIITGPSKTADIENKLVVGAQGPKEVHLILLDNGRSKLINHGFCELLHCLNCGACLNFCPVFNAIGGRYGGTYLGSRGVIQTAFANDPVTAREANCFACTLCQACQRNCPVGIDLPGLMKELRHFLKKEGVQTKENQEMLKNLEKYGNPFGKVEKGHLPKKLYCC